MASKKMGLASSAASSAARLMVNTVCSMRAEPPGTFEIYRKCWAKTEVSEVSTTGMYESFMREQKMCFTIRKAPKVIIKPKDYIIYKDKTYMIDEVIENRSWKEREYQVLTTTEVQDINAVAIEEVNKVESKGEIDYPGFFE